MSMNPMLILLPAIVFFGIWVSEKVSLIELDAILIFSTLTVSWLGINFKCEGNEVSLPYWLGILMLVLGVVAVFMISTMIAYATGGDIFSTDSADSAFYRSDMSIPFVLFDVITIACITILSKFLIKNGLRS